MNKFKSHFVFNRSQQNGIFLLVVIIIALQLVYFFVPFTSESSEDPRQEEAVRKIQNSIDSLKQVAATRNISQMAAFNPSTISDYKGYTLGMLVEEIDRLHAHRAQGLWINSSEEFQKVTGVSDSLLNIISPFFKFPDWTRSKAEEKDVRKKSFLEPLNKADLNLASAEDLQKVNGIGETFSQRIVTYRTKIDGFRGGIQLQDVYGLSPEVVEKVLLMFEVRDSTSEKMDLNNITVLQLSEMPYFNYELARSVIALRKKNERITSFEELEQIKNFPVEKIDRIKLYLSID